MEANFKNIYFTALDKQRELGEIVTNKDVKDCLDFAVNQEFWNMSEGFQNSLSNLLMKEYREHVDAKEQLKETRLKNLEKARLIKAIKSGKVKLAQVDNKTAKKDVVEIIDAEKEEEKELVKRIAMTIKDFGNKATKATKKKKQLNEGITAEELVTINGKTWRVIEAE